MVIIQHGFTLASSALDSATEMLCAAVGFFHCQWMLDHIGLSQSTYSSAMGMVYLGPLQIRLSCTQILLEIHIFVSLGQASGRESAESW